MKSEQLLELADACEHNDSFDFEHIDHCAVPMALKLFGLGITSANWQSFTETQIVTVAKFLEMPIEDAQRLFNPYTDYEDEHEVMNPLFTNENAILAIRRYANSGEDFWKTLYNRNITL